MSIEVANESGVGVDEIALVSVARYVLDRLGINPLAELSVLLMDVDAMTELHVKWMDEPGPTDVMSFPMDELRPPKDDDLRTLIRHRFEQHRVHVDTGCRPGRFGLQRLSAPDLAAVGRRRRIERHVLRLERPHAQAVVGEDAAQRGRDERFADVRGRAQDHERARRCSGRGCGRGLGGARREVHPGAELAQGASTPLAVNGAYRSCDGNPVQFRGGRATVSGEPPSTTAVALGEIPRWEGCGKRHRSAKSGYLARTRRFPNLA